MSKIFVSHSSKDSKVANRICAALEAKGLSCWIASRDINPGENFGEAIVDAIRAARLMLLVFSQNANNSNEIKKELVLAGQNQLIVVPVRVEDVVPGGAFAYELATRQWIDLFDDWDHAIERLAKWIQRADGDPGIAPPPRLRALEGDLAPTLAPDDETKPPMAPVPSPVEEAAAPPPAAPSSPRIDASLVPGERAPTRRRMLKIGGALAGVAALGGGVVLELQPGARLWRRLYDTSIRTYEGHTDSVHSVAFLPDGRTALSGSYDQTMALWDVASGSRLRTFNGHSDRVTSVAVTPDGRTSVSGSADSTVRVWDIATGRQRQEFEPQHYVWTVAVAPDGRSVLSGGEGPLAFWDMNSGNLIRAAELDDRIFSAVFSPDGSSALTAMQSGAVLLWSVATGRRIRTFKGHSDGVNTVAFSPDGRIAASGGDDRTIKLWNVATGEELRTLAGPASYVFSVAFTPDGGTLISGDGDNLVRVWDVASGRELRAFTGHSSTVASVKVSPDAQFVLSGGSDWTMKLWNLSGKT